MRTIEMNNVLAVEEVAALEVAVSTVVSNDAYNKMMDIAKATLVRKQEEAKATLVRKQEEAKARKEAVLAKLQEVKEIKARRREVRSNRRKVKSQARQINKANINMDVRIAKFLGLSDVVFKKNTNEGTVSQGGLQLLASGSATTSINNVATDTDAINNNTEGDSLMKMNLQLLSRKVNNKMQNEQNKAFAKLLNMNFLNTNNPEVLANAVNKVINQANGLTPMVTLATEKKKANGDDKKTLNVQSNTTSVSFGLIMRGRNRFNREISDFTRLLTKYTINGSTVKFTEDDMLIDEFVVLKADKGAIKENADKVFYVDFEKGIFATNQAEGVVNLLDGELVKNVDKLNQYMFLGASASSLREKFGFYGGVLAKTFDAKTGATRTVRDLVNNSCDGLMDYAKEKYTEVEAAKFAVRHMQYDTSSISMGMLGKVAKIDGAFDTGLMEIRNGKVEFINKSGGTFDGVVYMPVRTICEMFKCNEDVAMQLSLQARPGSLKVQVQVVVDELFDLVVEMHEALGNVTTYGVGNEISMVFDINAQKAEIDLENLELEVLKMITDKPSKPSKGLIEKVVVSALEEDVERNELDNNGKLKLNSYLTVIDRLKDLGNDGVADDLLNVLAGKSLGVSDLTNSSAICNKGVNTIPAAITGEAKNTAKSIQNSVNKLSYGKGIVDYLTITTDMGMLFGIKLLEEGEMFIPKNSNGNIDKVVAIKYPTMGMREYYSAELATIDRIMNSIANAEMPEILKIAFKGEAKAKFKAIKSALRRTYKRMSDALVVLPASMDVFNSCAGLDVDTDAMAIVYDDVFVNTLFGKEELIKLGDLKSEGNDNKVDNKFNASWNKKLNNSKLSATQKQRIQRAESNKYIFSDELFFFAKPYVNATRGNTESIGSISNSNSRVIAIYVQVLLGNMTGFNAFFKENFGTQKDGAKAKYVGLEAYRTQKGNGFIDNIDETIIDAIIEEAKGMDITDRGNAMRLLKDVNKAFRFYQEKTIDMAKTGGTLNVRFSCKSIIVTSLVDCNVIDVDNAKGNGFNFKISKVLPELKELEIRIKDANNQVVEEFKMNQVVVVDPMGKLQDMLIENANAMLTELVTEYKVLTFQQLPGQKVMNKNAVLKEVTVTDENGEEITSMYYDMSAALEKAHNKLANARGYNTRGLYVLKQLYIELAKQFKNNTNGLDPKEDEAIIEAYRNQYKNKLSWVANSCEYILSDINTGSLGEDYVTRGMILLAVGAKSVRRPSGVSKWDNMQVNGINPNSTNKFALNICDHYAKCYALNSNAVTVECKVIECDESLVGQTVELTNGMTDDMKLVVKDRFKADKVSVTVTRDVDTNDIKVLYTEKIKADSYNANLSSIVFEAEVVDAVNSNGQVVVDAGGNARKTTSCDVLAEVLKGEYATLELVETATDETIVVTKADGTTGTIDMDKELFTDVEPNVVYTIGSSFLAGEESEGLVAVELNR